MKPYKTIDKQLEVLRTRGLVISDPIKAKKYLLSNNYYNIINGYSKFFQETSDYYIDGVTFDEISALYIFDKDIKRALLQSILDAEHHIKSIMAYRFAEQHPNERYAYLNINSYDDTKILDVGFIVSKLSKTINYYKKKKGSSINHYISRHNDVPIWVLTDYLEFGDLRAIIKNLPTSLQNSIAKDLVSFIKTTVPDFSGVFPPETMIGFLKNINDTRNVCAHNNRLLSYKCPSNSAYFSTLHDRYNLTGDDSRKTVYSTIISLECFISRSEFIKLWNSIRKKVRKLDKKLNSIDVNVINSSLGFPDDWHKQPSLQE